MTTLIGSFIAIVLFGMVMIATISYGDSLGIMSSADSVALAQRLQSAAETASQAETSTGVRPRSLEDLEAAGLPKAVQGGLGTLSVHCGDADQACRPMAICATLPDDANARAVGSAAAGKIHGVLSGACADDAAPIAGQVVVTLRI